MLFNKDCCAWIPPLTLRQNHRLPSITMMSLVKDERATRWRKLRYRRMECVNVSKVAIRCSLHGNPTIYTPSKVLMKRKSRFSIKWQQCWQKYWPRKLKCCRILSEQPDQRIFNNNDLKNEIVRMMVMWRHQRCKRQGDLRKSDTQYKLEAYGAVWEIVDR